MKRIVDNLTAYLFEEKNNRKEYHIAAIVKGGKTIVVSLNQPAIRLGYEDHSHAEMNAINKFIKYIRLPTSELKKCSLVVIRIRKGRIVGSKPCYHCSRKINTSPLKAVYYSNNLGEIIKQKPDILFNDHVVRGNR
jgi:tRNA(Arg) A34 adenosine deaminase TadA